MTILDAGTYRAKAVEGALGETKSGKEQVAVRFRFVEEGLSTSHLTWYGYFTEKTTEGTFKALRAAGWKGSDLSDLSDLAREDVPEVDLVVEHETDDKGQTRARVRWVNSTGGIALGTQLAPDKAKAFAARMRGQVAAFDRAAGAPKPSPVPAKKVPAATSEVPLEVLNKQENDHASDDIPF